MFGHKQRVSAAGITGQIIVPAGGAPFINYGLSTHVYAVLVDGTGEVRYFVKDALTPVD